MKKDSVKFLISIFEVFYEDDWENGEMTNTYNDCFIEQKIVPNLREALLDFKKHYAENDELYLDDDFFHTDFMAMPTDYGWRKPTDEEIEEWKEGKLNLWNVEYQMKVQEISDISEDELRECYGDLITE